ncbi:molybdopterin-dependent oxidoreductase [Salmonella enterica subsp. enterica serovar 4,[5],12:i:-]|nr:molybdopterin-dependent oxidoreductase [Salmonella enterica subsp. enterica serovar 4,[5],12:i:-]
MMPGEKQQTGVSRRTLVKSAALGSLALAAGGVSLPFGMRTAAAAVQQAMRNEEDKIVWGACSVNCGSRCALRLHVKDNEVWWVETDNTGDDVYGNHQVRACLRGRSIRRRINHPDRLNYPMKRVGRRGEGKFERISWQEALDTISASLKKTVETYGNEAVYIHYSSGIVGGNITRSSPAASPVKRLMNCYGGSLNQYGSYSTAQISCAMPYTYGSNDGNSTSDIENSKLVVMFGNNPAETRMSGGGITWFLEQARERSNARMIVIDPRYTDTAAGREDEWIPIRPGTDAALVAGIAWVLINENLVDQPFLDNYCIGYDEKTLPADAPPNGHYKAYILGQGEDGIAKTPQWASHITGIPADRIIKLAREIGSVKPIYWVLSEIARRLGDDVYQRFTEGRTQAQWLQYLYAKMQARDPALPAYDDLKKMGIYKRKDPNGHFVAYKKFREDPQANPLKTPSGKIEIYSSKLAHIASTWELAEGDVISPLPIYTPTFEGWDDPKRSTFPLQLFGFHYKSRTHSSYGNIDVLQAACRQEVWINPLDAQKRGIANGDKVRVFNDRGEVRLPAKVTPRILPGVSAMGQGAWHNADMAGDKIDHGACINTLTTLRPSPLAKGNPQHTNLVEIEKI